MAQVHIRELYTGKILHSIDVGDRRVDPFPLDLANMDLSNLVLNRADLEWANLTNANLRGTKLKEATLFHADLTGADMRYCDVSKADLREAILENVDGYPLNADKHTKFWDAKIDSNSELSTLSASIMTARLRRSGEPDEFDLHVAQKAAESLLDPNTKRLEKTVARERRGWNSTGESAVLKAKMRVLRYTREIELNRVRRERDLRFLRKQRVDLSFASKLTSEKS
jgi:hypothetical protein